MTDPSGPIPIMRHGGDPGAAMRRYGIPSEDWLDLSTGINSVTYPFAFLEETDWKKLPQSDAVERLLAAARTAYDVPGHLAIAAVPGTDAAIRLLPALAGAPGPVGILGPTYSEHAAAFRAGGFTPAESGDIDAVLAAPVAVVVNPNNPTGTVVPPDSLLARWGANRAGGLLIVDEAFADCDPGVSVVPLIGDEPVVVLKSFGKFFGLAGLRLGFVIGAPEFVRQLAERSGPWAVSGPALAVGAQALADATWIADTRRGLRTDCDRFDAILAAHGLTPSGSVPLFRLVADRGAQALHERLAQNGIWTRIFDYDANWLRMGLPRSDEDRNRVAGALESLPAS